MITSISVEAYHAYKYLNGKQAKGPTIYRLKQTHQGYRDNFVQELAVCTLYPSPGLLSLGANGFPKNKQSTSIIDVEITRWCVFQGNKSKPDKYPSSL